MVLEQNSEPKMAEGPNVGEEVKKKVVKKKKVTKAKVVAPPAPPPPPKVWKFDTNILEMPMEILLEIFKYLTLADLNSVSLVCRTFLEATKYHKFMDSRELCLNKIDFDNEEPPISDLLQSERYFTAVTLYLVHFKDDNLFWMYFGLYIKELTFKMCMIKKSKFLSILRCCPNLESLTIYNFNEQLSTWDISYSEHYRLFLPRLKRLSFHRVATMDEEWFDYITDMAPNLEYLEMIDCLSGCTARQRVRVIDHVMYFLAVRGSWMRGANFIGTNVDDLSLGKLSTVEDLGLQQLSLSFNGKMSDEGMLALIHTQQFLTYLDLSDSLGLLDEGLQLICEVIRGIKTLKLRKCVMITCWGLKDVVKLKNLEVLDVTECERIKDEGLVEALSGGHVWLDLKRHFREMYMGSLKTVSEVPTVKIAELFPRMTVLDLSGSSNCVTDFTLQLINKNLLQLRVLNLEACSSLTDAGITGEGAEEENPRFTNSRSTFLRAKGKTGYPITRLTQLRVLKLAGCFYLTNTSAKCLAFKDLKEISLGRIHGITKEGFKSIAYSCPALEIIDMTECGGADDASVEIMTRYLKRIRTLKLICCHQVSEGSIYSIHRNCRVLKNLYIRGCHFAINPEEILSDMTCLKNIYFN